MKHIELALRVIEIVSLPFLFIISFYFNYPKEIVTIIFLASFVVISLTIFIVSHRKYRTSNEEVNLIYTLIYGKLKPTNLGKLQGFNLEILIVEDNKNKDNFSNSLKRLFKEDYEKGNLKLVTFFCDDRLQSELEERLINKLKTAKAVLIVRTANLEEKAWVYKTVDNWAINNPDLPCLYVKDISNTDCKSDIPKKYLYIPKDAHSVPWRLMQRSNDRSFLWNIHADFNREVLTHSVLLLFILFGFIVFIYLDQLKENKLELDKYNEQQKRYFNILKTAYNGGNENDPIKTIRDTIAIQTKEEFEVSVLKTTDSNLFVSYWIEDSKFMDKPLRQIGTSDPNSNRTNWEKNINTIVGCSFTYKSHFVEYNSETNSIKVFSENSVEARDKPCAFEQQGDKKIKSMVCFMKGRDSATDISVAICIRSDNKSKTTVQNYNYSDFLADKTRNFYKLERDLAVQQTSKPTNLSLDLNNTSLNTNSNNLNNRNLNTNSNKK